MYRKNSIVTGKHRCYRYRTRQMMFGGTGPSIEQLRGWLNTDGDKDQLSERLKKIIIPLSGWTNVKK